MRLAVHRQVPAGAASSAALLSAAAASVSAFAVLLLLLLLRRLAQSVVCGGRGSRRRRCRCCSRAVAGTVTRRLSVLRRGRGSVGVRRGGQLLQSQVAFNKSQLRGGEIGLRKY